MGENSEKVILFKEKTMCEEGICASHDRPFGSEAVALFRKKPVCTRCFEILKRRAKSKDRAEMKNA